MQTTSGCGRIVKRRLADGSLSFTFSVVRNMRINGRPSHVDLAKIGTFRQNDFPARAEEFWSIVDRTLSDLVKTGKLMKNDRLKIENQFAKFCERPAPAVAKTDNAEPSNVEIINKLILEIGEKAERKLELEFGRKL